METVDGSNAVVVVSAGGKATVVTETAKGKRLKLPLSVLKDVQGVAELAAGEGQEGPTGGAELTRQVTTVVGGAPGWRCSVAGLFAQDLARLNINRAQLECTV